MTTEHTDDITILRVDPSISENLSGGGSGQADAPRVLKQRFVLEEKLGSGGMGTVFRAKDLRKVEARDRQPYLAIKVLNNDFREHPEAFIALQREAAKSQTLSHPNIVSIYDFDKDGDIPFMTMELLEGQELAAMLRAYPNGLPEPVAWSVIRGACAGLAHAHGAGIVHADFKPGNVFVSSTNSAKILDFGIARAVQLTDVQGDDTVFDPARLAALTPAYASREMLAGDNPETRDDLYSLGIVIYLILTGHHPYGRLSAEDAATEGLKPERPKGVSRRQWQVITRCLAFNRQDRPMDVAEVEKYLLTPSPWRSRSAMAAAATLVLALSANYLIDDAELTEVKQEVRQTTLLDSQIARLDSLLAVPLFDENWEQALAAEYTELMALEVDAPAAEEGVPTAVATAVQQLTVQIRQAYTTRILTLADLDRALVLLDHGSAYGALIEARNDVQIRAFARVREVLDNGRPEQAWLEDLRFELGRLERNFADSPALAELDLEIDETLEMLVLDALSTGNLAQAEMLLSELSPRLFDALVLADLTESMASARARLAAAREASLIARAEQGREADLDEALAASCLRLDLNRVASLRSELARPAAADSRIEARVGECLGQLAELDPDRAQSLKLAADRAFNGALVLADVRVDSCSLSYLVGNGSQAGRQGYCADRLGDDGQGPKLVVLPTEDGGHRFAMTKQEVSWAQFRRFCIELEGCRQTELELPGVDDRLPVTGISLETVVAFSRWLTKTSGHTYRLPTKNEWLWAARGEPDPNRNCRVNIDGIERGSSAVAAATGAGNEFGLQNMLGNVQEWAMDGDRLVALGGSFADPIGICLAATERDHDGKPASDTGFRLVREVS